MGLVFIAEASRGKVVSKGKLRSVVCRADFENMGGLVSYLVHDCCKNHPSVSKCCTMKLTAGEWRL
jgi:hypothetical protein